MGLARALLGSRGLKDTLKIEKIGLKGALKRKIIGLKDTLSRR
jgi:hypothetical protein